MSIFEIAVILTAIVGLGCFIGFLRDAVTLYRRPDMPPPQTPPAGGTDQPAG